MAVAVSPETNRPASTPPPATLSVTLAGTPVTCLVSVVSAVPVGPLLADAAVPPPLFSFTRTSATTMMATTRIAPPAR